MCVCVCVCTTHLLYPFSVTSVDGCLGYFHVLAVINSCSIATIGTENIGGCRYLFELWFSPDICPEVGLLGHMVSFFSDFFTNL